VERPPTRARREEGAALLDPLLRAAPAPRRAGGRKRGALERFERLLAAGWARARALALVDARPEAAVDATGFESRHVSLHFRIRRGREAGRRRHKRAWPKLTIVSHSATHLIAAAVPSRGPSQDAAEFAPALRQARRVLAIHRLLADAAYDAEHNHTLCRQELGIRSTAIRLNPRSTGRKWPKTRYRRQMRRRFPKRQYRQRWQVESTFSQHKRRLGSALTARGDAARAAEERLRALTHNLMILRRAAKGFQQSKCSTQHSRGHTTREPYPACKSGW